MVTKNSNKTIMDSLLSLKKQRFRNYELVVQDGASIDATISMVRSIFPNAKIESTEDTGIYNALNRAVARTEGKFVVILHSDDVFYSELILEQVANYLNINQNVCVYCGSCIIRYSDYLCRVWHPINLFLSIMSIKLVPPHTSTIVSRKCFDLIGDFNEDFRISGDYDWLMRLLQIIPSEHIAMERNII